MRHQSFRVLRALFTALTILVCAELLLRLVADPPIPWDPAPFRFRWGAEELDDHYRLSLAPGHPVAYSSLPRDRFLTRRKAPGVFRIVLCGESAIYGTGLPVTASPWWRLERLLESRIPGRKWEVLSLAREGCSASVQFRSLIRALDEFSPDLVILEVGNNEFLAILGYRCAFPDYDAYAESARCLYRRSRLYGLLYKFMTKWAPLPDLANVSVSSRNMDASLIMPGDTDLVEESYEHIIEAMCKACQSKSVPVVLCTVPINRCFPPNQRLTPDVGKYLNEPASLRLTGHPDEALEVLRQIPETLDDPHVPYEMGMCLLALGRKEEALRALNAAVQEDRHPRRAMPWFSSVLRRVGDRLSVPVCDVAAGLDRMSPRGIAGNEDFLDFCHFSSLGSRKVARLMTEFLLANNLLPSVSENDVRSGSSLAQTLALEDWPGPQEFIASIAAGGVPAKGYLKTFWRIFVDERKGTPYSRWLPPLEVAQCADVDKLRLYGHFFCADDDYDDALACYLRAAQVSSTGDAEVYFEAGMAAMLGARLDIAVAMLERGVALRPGDPIMVRKLDTLRRVNERSTSLPPLPRIVPDPTRSWGPKGPHEDR